MNDGGGRKNAAAGIARADAQRQRAGGADASGAGAAGCGVADAGAAAVTGDCAPTRSGAAPDTAGGLDAAAGQRTRARWAAAAGLAVLSAFYVGAVAAVEALVPAALVTHTAWVALYAVCLGAAVGLRRNAAAAAAPPRAWLAVAVLTVLIASLFGGANFALDTLNGPHRAKADVARHLGGLELWWVLCPGAVSVALAAALRAALLQPGR